MMHNADRMTLHWEYIKSLEPPQVSHVRAETLLVDDNLFAQVTVKMLSQQILAVYDRFGRLIHGHPHVAKDVEEYVVFESHIVSQYSRWRLHDKIIPEWLAAKREPGTLTSKKEFVPEVKPVGEEEITYDSDDEADDEKPSKIRDKFGNAMKK